MLINNFEYLKMAGFSMDEELKNIKINLNLTGSLIGENMDEINRDIVKPEDIQILRRTDEGIKPIFDREDISVNKIMTEISYTESTNNNTLMNLSRQCSSQTRIIYKVDIDNDEVDNKEETKSESPVEEILNNDKTKEDEPPSLLNVKAEIINKYLGDIACREYTKTVTMTSGVSQKHVSRTSRKTSREFQKTNYKRHRSYSASSDESKQYKKTCKRSVSPRRRHKSRSPCFEKYRSTSVSSISSFNSEKNKKERRSKSITRFYNKNEYKPRDYERKYRSHSITSVSSIESEKDRKKHSKYYKSKCDCKDCKYEKSKQKNSKKRSYSTYPKDYYNDYYNEYYNDTSAEEEDIRVRYYRYNAAMYAVRVIMELISNY